MTALSLYCNKAFSDEARANWNKGFDGIRWRDKGAGASKERGQEGKDADVQK